MKKLLVVLLVSMSLGVSIPLCFPDIAQSWEEGLDGEYGGDTSSGGTGTSSGNDDTCSGGGSATGGCDGGGGNTGPSPEEVADEGAAGYEQEAAGLSVNALSANTSLRGWDDYFNESRSTYDGLADSVFGSADRIGGYGARAEDDWQGARSYLSEFDAFELQQLETPSQLLSEIDEIIEKLQGPRLNDPVIVASGIETFTAVDAKYEALLGEIAIKRTYRSTHNAPKSSFGSGWFFNYDTNIVVGRKPLIKEKELLASDLSVKMIDLQADIAETLDLSLAESANAGIALDTAIAELTNMQQASEQYASIIPLIEEYLAGAQSAANAAEELRSQGTEAAGASADQAWGHVTQIQAILDFAIERRQAMESVLVAAEQKLAATKDAANSQIPGVVEQISQYKTEIAAMTTDITERKAKAVAEARAEELRFPNDPYPADPSVYFGAGYIKVIDEEGSPILYRIGEDGQYHPISDHGSDTSVLRETETAYQRVDKHGRITEFAKTGTGRATLTVTRDTNGNETLFTRLGNILTVTDPVERVTTVTYTPEGFISTVVDPQGRTHSYSYQGGQLVGYTDPVGNTWRYGYDGENRLISRTDPLSHVYRYTYDGLGRVLSEIDEAGFAIDYSYDPENRVTTVTDRRGFARQYHYNEAQRVETIVHPDGSSVSFTYDEKNNIASTTNENGATTFFTYNAFNDILTITDELGNVTSYTYEPSFNKMATVTDPLGHTRSFTYDGRGNLITVSHPDGTTQSFTYDQQGLLTSTTDENGQFSQLTYDAYGQPIRITNPDGTVKTFENDILGKVLTATDENGNATSFDYDPNGNLIRTIDPLGAETIAEYDALGHRIQETNALGNSLQYRYTERGNLDAIIDPLGNTETRFYDPGEKLVRVTYPDGTGVEYEIDSRERVVAEIRVPTNLVTQYVYDAGGRQTAVTDANGNTTSKIYDPLGRVVAIINAEGYTVASEYDAAGNLLSVKDGNGNPRIYAYDVRNRLVAETDALGNTTSYVHDGVGNIITRKKPDGSLIANSYDTRNRLVEVAYQDGTKKQFDYDNVGNMIGLGNSETSETRSYDPLGRLVTATDLHLGRIEYLYDLAGNRTSMIDSAKGLMRYEYDANDRLVTFTDPEGGRTFFEYDKMGRIFSTLHPNNTETIQEYDSVGNLISIATYGDREGVVSSFAYTYDAVGNRLSMVDRDGAVTGYTYDNIYQLVAVDYPHREWEPELSVEEKNNGTNNGKGEKNGHFKNRCDITLDCLPSQVTYTYDAAGNRLTMTDDWQTTSYSYNTANQMVRAGTASFIYDANGNRIQKSDGAELANYAYTSDDLLAQVDSPNGDMTGYRHDALNRRIYTVNQDGPTTFYLYDGLDVLQEVTGQLDQKIATYYRANGRIITRQEFNVSQGENLTYQNRPTGRQLYYSYDGLGSTATLTNHDGNLVTSYQYDVYGQLTGGDIRENPYTFTGKRFDEESGLYYFHYRQYDPAVGVWTAADPIGVMGGVNVYEYVQNDPVNFIDPMGLRTWSLGISLSGGLGLGGGGGTFLNIGHDPSKGLLEGWSASLTGTAEGGAFGGIGAGTQFQFNTTDAYNVSQLTGEGMVFGQAAGAGIQGGVEYVTNIGGSVKGASYYLGFGMRSTYATPISTYAFGTTTSPIFSISQGK